MPRRSPSVQRDTGVPVEIGRSFVLESSALGERRVVDVTLPSSYHVGTDRRHPVVYLLDGEFIGPVAATMTKFYADASQLPELIVVAVRNTDRTRDMTPPPVAGYTPPPEMGAMSGGADRFLAFLVDELIPWVDTRYRTAPMRVLAGASLGGLFALHALAKKPEVFTGYLVMEPAVWWNNEHELNAARSVHSQPAARRARVITVNTAKLGVDSTQWGGAKPMVRHLTTTGSATRFRSPRRRSTKR